MAFVHELLEGLEGHWSAKTKGIFEGLQEGPGVMWEDMTILAGSFNGLLTDAIMLDLAPFVPADGFSFGTSISSIVAIPGLNDRALPFFKGDSIVCCGQIVRTAATTWKANGQVTLMKRPLFDQAGAWDFVHYFAGAFHGWAQAVNVLPKLVDSFRVDVDAEVAQVWIAKHHKPCHVGPLLPRKAFEMHAQAFVHTQVFDHTVFHLLAPQGNLCFTASPPCQPWSRGGRAFGIASSQGWAFVDAVRITIAGQPLMLALECVDEVATHSHFAILEELLRIGGYRCAWQRVVPFHQVSHIHRSRWLGVWLRLDVFALAECPSLPLRVEKIIPRSAQHYRFTIPKGIREQLCLSQSELRVYGDIHLLPTTKRKILPENAPMTSVLRARLQDPFEPLPTLCASYSNQHNLAKSHLAVKGIFATLDSDGKDFFFLDPFAHIALLGATESTVVSSKIVLAFRQIGNAISVPQALLTLCIGFKTLMSWEVDLTDLVRKCWAKRLTSFSSFVIQCSRFATLCSAQAFVHEFTIEAATQPLEIECVRWKVMHCRTEATKTIFLPADWKVSQVPDIFRWHFDVRSHIFCQNEDFKHCQQYTLHDYAVIVRQCQVCIDGLPFLQVDMMPQGPHLNQAPPQTQEADCTVISPTLPMSIHVPKPGCASNPCPLDFDAIAPTNAFRQVLESTEHCLRSDQGVPALFAFRCPAMSFTGLVSEDFLSPSGFEIVEPSGKRIRLSVSQTESPSQCAFFLATQTEDGHEPWFAFVRSSGAIGVAQVNKQPVLSNLLHIGTSSFAIEYQNGLQWSNNSSISQGDVLVLSYQGPIHAGGHHAGGPQVLAPGASFEARCEFAVNTSGWIAVDEMTFWVQHVQWLAPGYAYFSMPVHWDDDNGDFDFGPQVEFAVPNNRLTVIPILLRSHWCAVEVNRASHLVTALSHRN